MLLIQSGFDIVPRKEEGRAFTSTFWVKTFEAQGQFNSSKFANLKSQRGVLLIQSGQVKGQLNIKTKNWEKTETKARKLDHQEKFGSNSGQGTTKHQD